MQEYHEGAQSFSLQHELLGFLGFDQYKGVEETKE